MVQGDIEMFLCDTSMANLEVLKFCLYHASEIGLLRLVIGILTVAIPFFLDGQGFLICQMVKTSKILIKI